MIKRLGAVFEEHEGDCTSPVLLRLLVTAMREPTEEMLYRANEATTIDTGHGFDCRVAPSEARLIWRAMIDAVLNE